MTQFLKVVTIKLSMRTIIRSILFYSYSLYITSQLFAGLRISGGIQTIFTGGFILALMSLILRPILQVISFPINILSLGLFGFIINAVILYLLTRFVPHIMIESFTVQRLSLRFITIPTVHLNIFFAFIFLAFMVSFLVTGLSWLTKE